MNVVSSVREIIGDDGTDESEIARLEEIERLLGAAASDALRSRYLRWLEREQALRESRERRADTVDRFLMALAANPSAATAARVGAAVAMLRRPRHRA